MIREWASKFRKSVSKRVVSRRRDFQVPIKITIEPDRHTGSLRMPESSNSISGETKDLSMTGIAFVVSSIRVQESYLVGEGRLLNAELNLPNGKIQIKLVGQRYKQIGKHVSTTKYLVGAEIVRMSDRDKALYKEFLKDKKLQTGTFELSTDEG